MIVEDKDLRQLKVEIQSAEAGKEYESWWLFLIDQKTFTVLMLIIVHKCSFIEFLILPFFGFRGLCEARWLGDPFYRLDPLDTLDTLDPFSNKQHTLPTNTKVNNTVVCVS